MLWGRDGSRAQGVDLLSCAEPDAGFAGSRYVELDGLLPPVGFGMFYTARREYSDAPTSGIMPEGFVAA